MPLTRSIETVPAIARIHRLLEKIDRLRLPPGSRRDVECILVRQAAREIARALPAHAGHGHRTALMAAKIGRKLSLTADALHHLTLAAYLHDIGLLMLPHDLVKYRNRLDGDSYRAVRNHARLGGSFLEAFAFLATASIIVAHHHERWDGTGYPYGIRGIYIPLEARILTVADAFDAIEVPGADSQALRDHVACRIIQVASGTQFDPSIVAAFVDVLNYGASAMSAEKIHE